MAARNCDRCGKAEGDVLELGVGTGRNLPYYDRARVRRLVGVDPAVQMHRLARRRARQSGIDIEVVGLPAQRLPLADASFDTVVCTFTLCSIADPAAALAEARRVLRPGGPATCPDPDSRAITTGARPGWSSPQKTERR